jgi:transposase
MNRAALSQLSKIELIDIILAQARQIERLERRIAELEAKLGEPPKDAKNSSVPPSRSRKANQPDKPKGARREASRGRRGGGRRLEPDPDQTIVAKLKACPVCRTAMAESEQWLHAAYDRIELPPVRAVVTRVEQYAARCSGCRAALVAPVPAGLEAGSPFGGSVAALAVYLRYVHTISYQRLSALFRHLFALNLSKGALANLFQRTKPRFEH